MSALPPEARARIDAALAEVELAAIDAQQARAPIEGLSRRVPLVFYGETAPPSILAAALDAFATIVEVVSDLPWTAGDRRRLVDAYEKQLCTGRPFTAAAFAFAKREQPWWRAFQQTLLKAEKTDVRSTNAQLRAWMDEARLSAEDLAHLTGVDRGTISRHYKGTQPLTRRSVIKKYETALSKALDARPIQFVLPVKTPNRSRRPRTPQHATKRR